jgi:hypothetical protein
VLQTQSAFTAFIEAHQGAPPMELQEAFAQFIEKLNKATLPVPSATLGKELVDELI